MQLGLTDHVWTIAELIEAASEAPVDPERMEGYPRTPDGPPPLARNPGRAGLTKTRRTSVGFARPSHVQCASQRSVKSVLDPSFLISSTL
jgi:hypothetical protein